MRPGGLGAEPLGVVPGGDQEQRGGVRADAVQGHQAGGVPGDQGHDERIEADDLAVQELGAAAQLPQRQRTVPAAEFFQGYYSTAASPDEMITELWFPRAAPRAVLTEFAQRQGRSEDHTSELQSLRHPACR